MTPERRRDGGAAADIGQAGLHAASLVVEQMLSLSRQLASSRLPLSSLDGDDQRDGQDGQVRQDEHRNGSSADGPGPGTRRQELRRLRADAERLIELYGDWTRTLLDGVSDLAESTEDDPEVLVIGPVAPGELATATIWVELLGGPPMVPAELHATDLVSHDRSRVVGTSVTFEPGAIDVGPEVGRDDAAAVAVEVRLAVPGATVPGHYHGHVLAAGLPEVHLTCILEVR